MTKENSKSSNPQTEPFDYERFAVMYPNSNSSCRLCRHINDTDRRFYTELYYSLDEVSTIIEFVELLDHWDETS